MPATDTATDTDARTRRLYAGVLLCEALTILGLWLFERAFR